MKQQQALNDFILNWNRNHANVLFSMITAPVIGRPVSIEVRFSPERYQKFISEEMYDRLRTNIVNSSKGLMVLTTDYDLFRRGIIEFKVSSASGEYRESIIANSLDWVGGRFFPHGY